MVNNDILTLTKGVQTMKSTRAKRYNYLNNYNTEHYERFNAVLAPGTNDKIERAAEKLGISKSEFVRQAIEKALEE